jgi:choline-glycine betaine transporter
MGLSILSALSGLRSQVPGVRCGVKSLSKLNLVRSTVLLPIFVIFGSFAFAATTYGTALGDYLQHFASLSVQAYSTDTALSQWQAANTAFYWAWRIAFSPFIGLFFARTSCGRTVREFVLGAVIMPSLVCFALMTILGGTSVDLELSRIAQGSIANASQTDMLFATLQHIISKQWFKGVAIMCVVLILTILVTSADSGLLVINTIMDGRVEETSVMHRIIWAVCRSAL